MLRHAPQTASRASLFGMRFKSNIKKPHPDWNAALQADSKVSVALRRAGVTCIPIVQIVNNFLAECLNASPDGGHNINAQPNDCTRQHDPVNGHSPRFVFVEKLIDFQEAHKFYSFQMVILQSQILITLPRSLVRRHPHRLNLDDARE